MYMDGVRLLASWAHRSSPSRASGPFQVSFSNPRYVSWMGFFTSVRIRRHKWPVSLQQHPLKQQRTHNLD